MSKVEVTTVPVVKTVDEPRYVLTLTEDEALAVCALLGTLAGGRDTIETYPLFQQLDDVLDDRLQESARVIHAIGGNRVGALKVVRNV